MTKSTKKKQQAEKVDHQEKKVLLSVFVYYYIAEDFIMVCFAGFVMSVSFVVSTISYLRVMTRPISDGHLVSVLLVVLCLWSWSCPITVSLLVSLSWSCSCSCFCSWSCSFLSLWYRLCVYGHGLLDLCLLSVVLVYFFELWASIQHWLY